MTKLTKEQVKFFIETMTDDMHNTTQHEIAETLLSKFDECESLQARLLAYEQAAEHPAARITWDGSEFSVSNVSEDFLYGGTAVYLAPVLPKQPELIGMKVSIDTGSDNIGHRLFGEIVGTSESNGVPVLCIEVTENNVDVAAPAQPVIPEQPDAQDLELYIDMLENSDSDDQDGELNNTQLIMWLKELQRRRTLPAQPANGDKQ